MRIEDNTAVELIVSKSKTVDGRVTLVERENSARWMPYAIFARVNVEDVDTYTFISYVVQH